MAYLSNTKYKKSEKPHKTEQQTSSIDRSGSEKLVEAPPHGKGDVEPGFEQEGIPERPEDRGIEGGGGTELSAPTASSQGSTSSVGLPQSLSAARQKKIEHILEDGLEDIYLHLPEAKRVEFKIAGEQTAKEINSLFDKAKVTAKKIVALIRRWLALIPGINRFFLEQMTKIKTDEILKLKNNNE